jgi:hypothetical protein
MSDSLDTLSDDQLNLLFKAEVTDWGVYDGAHFCTNTNDVLPWLEKSGHFPLIMRPHHGPQLERVYEVLFHGVDQKSYAPTLARALVLALIRAKRLSR